MQRHWQPRARRRCGGGDPLQACGSPPLAPAGLLPHTPLPCTATCTACCSVKVMYHHVNPKNGEQAPLIDAKVYAIIMEVGGWCCVVAEEETRVGDARMVQCARRS